MRLPDRFREARGRGSSVVTGVVVFALAAGVFGVTALSPVESVRSDPAIALLAAQGVVQHGSLSLDVFRQDPRLVYDLDSDWRVREWAASHYYYSPGLPLLLAPAVWVANGLGWDMLVPGDEYALQNLLSAGTCAVVFLLLYGMFRSQVGETSSMVLSLVFVLGTALASTLGTALWSSNLSIVCVCAALWHIVARGNRSLEWRLLVPVLALGLVARPTTAFFAVALGLSMLAPTRRRLAVGLMVFAGGLAAILSVGALGWLDWLPAYYSWRKLLPEVPLPMGLTAHLISPSRGLFVFSPFLLVVVLGAWRVRRPGLRDDRAFRLCVLWIVFHLLAVSVKGMWWGGHSFGPRLLAELIPGFAALAAFSWRAIGEEASGRRREWAFCFLLLCVPAIAINSIQGLFNPAAKRWNEEPNIDANALLVFDWNYPQFLASDAMIAKRSRLLQVARLRPLPFDRRIAFDDWRYLAYSGWAEPETSWRWSTAKEASLVFLSYEEAPALLLVEVEAGAVGEQSIAVRFNDEPVGSFVLSRFEERSRTVAVPGSLLTNGQNRLTFEIPGAAPVSGDSRSLGLALRALQLHRVVETAPVRFSEDRFFGEGWSDAESGWRWTEEREATVFYPFAGRSADGVSRLHLVAGANGSQTLRMEVNGRSVGTTRWNGFEPLEQSVLLPAGLLSANALNTIRLHVAGASPAPDDSRLLGLAVRELWVESVVP